MTLSCLNTRCVAASYPGRTLEQDVLGKAIKRCGSVYISSHSRQQGPPRFDELKRKSFSAVISGQVRGHSIVVLSPSEAVKIFDGSRAGGKNISTSDWDSNPDLPVFGSLAYCESDAVDHAATEAGSSKPRLKMCEPEDEKESIPLLISRKLWSL
uniref:Uncharacterized protein n=1 Tax=Timema douglasi TaxID=61478 RepID=A0A7R8Z9D5_TIMDO|nr:unnamed protein product [Timema douglasi]